MNSKATISPVKNDYDQSEWSTSAVFRTRLTEVRRAIARELHDTVVQDFIIIMMQIGNALESHEPSERDRLLFQSAQTAREGLCRARAILRSLRSQDQTPYREQDKCILIECVEAELTAAFRQFPRRLMVRGNRTVALPRNVTENVLRIVREAAGNVVRHAHATQVDCHMEVIGGSVRLCISDNGIGTPIENMREGLGILGMRERAQLIGGTLHIKSETNRGTSVILRVPVDRMWGAYHVVPSHCSPPRESICSQNNLNLENPA